MVARVLVALRWVLVPGVIAAVVWLGVNRPGLEAAPPLTLEDLIPMDLPAMSAQEASLESFAVPALSRQAVVQYRADGLSIGTQAETYLRAAQATAGRMKGAEDIAGVLPITNAGEVLPSSSQSGTTMVSYVFFRPSVSTNDRMAALRAYEATLDHPDDGFVGLTGMLVARTEQGEAIKGSMRWVEIGSVAAVVLIVGLMFRSLGAPLLTLGMSVMAIITTTRLLVIASERFGIGVGQELQAIIVALLVGLMTDYVVFFLTRFRRKLRRGAHRLDAAREAAAEVIPLVLTAAATVAGGTGALTIAKLGIFSRLGPGLALAVVVALVLTVLFVPAVLAIAGGLLLWPGLDRTRDAPEGDEVRGLRGRFARIAVRRPWAAVVIVVGVGILVAAALPARNIEFGVNMMEGLPASNEASQAADLAARGFAPGIVGPTEVLLAGDGVTGDTGALDELQQRISSTPGVAGVVGPTQNPLGEELGLFLSPDGDMARFIVVLDSLPSTADAIDVTEHLSEVLPSWIADLDIDATPYLAGDTALSGTLVDLTRTDLFRVGLVVLGLDVLLLGLFLRSIITPLVVLAASTLTVLAAVSLTTIFSEHVLGVPALTFYVPVAVFVLLVSFAADYSVYIVGRIWDETHRRDLPDAIVVAGSQAAHAISVAGLALATTFALLLLIPLAGFRQLGVAMAIGILLDIFFVRSFLLPSLVAILGRWAGWPNSRLRERLRHQ